VNHGNDTARKNSTCEVDSVGGRLRERLIPQGGVLRTNREDYAIQLAELRERARSRPTPTPINIGILVSTVLRVIVIGKETAITTLISTPRSEDFQSMVACFGATDGQWDFVCAVVGLIVTSAPNFME
jgi:hypothetical protein